MPNVDRVRDLFQRGLHYHHYANTAYPLTPRSFEAFRVKGREEIEALLRSEWEKCREMSLYAHVPFCKVRCKFCEYAVLQGEDAQEEDLYVSLLLAEIARYGDIVAGARVVGYDLGGGTPSKLSLPNLERITRSLVETFRIPDSVCFSVETTPLIAATEPEKIQGLFDLGYRRISMGIQTVSEKLLNELGREGATSMYENAVRNIRRAGFQRLNLDLMYGFLHQDLEDFEHTLRYAVGLAPEYITLYRNRYKGTKIEGEAPGVSIYKVIEQYRMAFDLLNGSGYAAQPGKNTFSRLPGDHGTSDYLTQRVVRGVPYLGLGLGAQSFGDRYLAYNHGAASKTLASYRRAVESGALPIQDIYALDLEEAVAKMVSVAFYFGFVDYGAFRDRFGRELRDMFPEETEYVLDEGFMEERSGGIHLTPRGADYINGIIPLFHSERSKREMEGLARGQRKSQGEALFLGGYDPDKFDRPSMAVDMVAVRGGGDRREVLLIRRGEHPFMDRWALPGGFVRRGETVEAAARRELSEEAGLEVGVISALAVRSEPGRDPRGWVVSCPFLAEVVGEERARFGSDAIDARWFSVQAGSGREVSLVCGDLDLPLGDAQGVPAVEGLAFDHAAILREALSGVAMA